MKRHVEQFRRHLWLRRVCYGLMLLAGAAIVGFMALQLDQGRAALHRSALTLPTSLNMPNYWHRELQVHTPMGDGPQIEDMISFGTEILFLVHVPPSFVFPNRENLQCQFGQVPSSSRTTKVLAVHRDQEFVAAVVCGAPPANLTWDATSATLKLRDTDQEIRNPDRHPLMMWNSTKVVYAVFAADANDVVVFAHGLNQTPFTELPKPEHFQRVRCVYANGFETAVTAEANEVVRCAHPPKFMINSVSGKKMTLKLEGTHLSSLAYYNPQSPTPLESDLSNPKATLQVPVMQAGSSREGDLSSMARHHICACTMIYNEAKFLREWVYFHSHLGVQKFFFYDNNSEDNLDEVLGSLSSFNVTKQSWPWVKTQEAALSHCALVASRDCEWMLFTDVDEYIFPNEHFREANQSSILATFIAEAATVKELVKEDVKVDVKGDVKVGQIAVFCNNYGPSGLSVSPPEGVTQGYTCRIKRHRRHKSVVLLRAVDESLGNQVHHFSLRAPFVMAQIKPWVAVINHYKFQVWDEFKKKFHRRAATYVADWSEDRNHGSNDRVPGLGTKPVKPRDWESRYCEVQDYSLRDYTRRIFGSESPPPLEGGLSGKKLHLAWE